MLNIRAADHLVILRQRPSCCWINFIHLADNPPRQYSRLTNQTIPTIHKQQTKPQDKFDFLMKFKLNCFIYLNFFLISCYFKNFFHAFLISINNKK